MTDAPNIEIRAHVEDLKRRLADLGPVERIKNAEVRAWAQQIQTTLTFIERNMAGAKPDEDYQWRAVKHAWQQWHNLVVTRDIVPTLKAKQDLSEAAKNSAIKSKLKAAKNDAKLKNEAKKILETNPAMTFSALALRLSGRDKLGSVQYIRKKLSRLLHD